MRFKMRPIEWEREWHSWFAWYPIATDKGMFVWLERVERRQYMRYSGYACDRIKLSFYRLPNES